VFIPEFSLFREQRSPTPTLILTGERSTRISLDDCRAIAKHYPMAGMDPEALMAHFEDLLGESAA